MIGFRRACIRANGGSRSSLLDSVDSSARCGRPALFERTDALSDENRAADDNSGDGHRSESGICVLISVVMFSNTMRFANAEPSLKHRLRDQEHRCALVDSTRIRYAGLTVA